VTTTRETLTTTLFAIEDLLRQFGEPTWAATVHRVARQADAAWSAGSPSDAARIVLRLFDGAMGGFGDLVLQPSGKVKPEVQAMLAALLHQLFGAARDAL
jgi:hypothetical protein